MTSVWNIFHCVVHNNGASLKWRISSLSSFMRQAIVMNIFHCVVFHFHWDCTVLRDEI